MPQPTKKSKGADPSKNSGITDIAHEDIPGAKPDGNGKAELLEADEVKPGPELSIEEQKKNEIAKFNFPEAAIAQYQKEYGKLKIKGLEDKEGYKKVETAWRHVRGRRIEVEKKHKLIKAGYLEIGRAIDAEKNRLVELLEPLETKLGGELERIDNEKKAKDEEKERQEQEKLNVRVNDLIANGAAFTGSFYGIGETISIDVVTLKAMNDGEFNLLLSRVKVENAKIAEEKQRKADEEQAERDRLEKQRKEQEAEAQRLKDLQQKMESDRRELEQAKEKLLEDRTANRAAQIEGLGFVFAHNSQNWVLNKTVGVVEISKTQVVALSDTEWLDRFAQLTADSDSLKARQADAENRAKKLQDEAHALKVRTEDRRADLISYGLWHDGDGNFYRQSIYENIATVSAEAEEILKLSQEGWKQKIKAIDEQIAIIRQAEAEQKIIEDGKKEAARQALLSERQKLVEYVDKVSAIKKPELSDPKLKNEANRIALAVQNVIDFLNGKE